jgi:serine/threonine-protein kinase
MNMVGEFAKSARASSVPPAMERIGRFRVVRRLGSAGGNTYLGSDEGDRTVVLKVLEVASRNQGLFDPRVADEAAAYARLSHPNLVRVLDLFSADGKFVIVLEHFESSALNVVQASMRRAGVDLGDAAALYVGTCLFAAVAAAHAARTNGALAPVLHRNINPSNVFVDARGDVKLGNFNVANVAIGARDANAGFTWGSYGYCAPEQVRCEDVGPPADVYAASLVLWELLARRKAIVRESLTEAELLERMAEPRIPALETIRPDLDARLLQAMRFALEPEADKRMISAASMLEAIVQAAQVGDGRTALAHRLVRIQSAARAAPLPASAAPPLDPADDAASPDDDPQTPWPRKALDAPFEPASASSLAEAGTASETSEPSLLDVGASGAPAEPSPYSGEAEVSPEPWLSLPGPVEEAAEPPPARAMSGDAPEPATVSVRPISVRPASVRPERPTGLPATEPPWRDRAACTSGTGGVALDASERAIARRGPRALPAAAIALLVACAGAVWLAHRARQVPLVASSPPVATSSPADSAVSILASSEPPPPVARPAPVLPSASIAPEAAAASTPPAAPTSGALTFAPSAAGHRIYVDGRVVGEGARPLRVRCGVHAVRIGASGPTQTVDVPCGGTASVRAR